MNTNFSNVLILDSGKPGPIIAIIGGIHGDEQCGVKALDCLGRLKLINGRVYLITGNPKAIDEKIRYTEMDLNRSFRENKDLLKAEKRTYEYRCSREIIPYLKKSDILLDIHSSATKESVPFIICDKKDVSLVGCLPLSIVCYGFGKIHKGSTDDFMNKMGKVGIVIECGYSKDPMATNTAIQSAKSLLGHLGMIKFIRNKKTAHKNFQIFRISKSYKTQTNNFKLVKNFADFEKIKKGQIIAKDGDIMVLSDRDQFILFARDHNLIGKQGFVYLLKDGVINKNKKIV